MYINNTFYICNYCVEYKTNYKGDIKKHFTKKNKCKSYLEKYSFEEAFNISVIRRYTFTFDTSNLCKKDYAFIINNYINIDNYISEDFTNTNLILENNNQEYKIKNNMELINIEEDGEDNKFICYDCLTEYSSKRYLLNHMENKSLCEYKRKYNLYLKKAEEEKINKINNKQNILINNGNIINNNFQNNVQNNGDNGNLKIVVNDFMNEKYDLTHISDDFYKQKDFFTFNKFFEQIMLNKKNHNIYFIDNNNSAIIYTEDELNKVSSEKIGYIILEKIEQAFNQMYYKQDDEAKEYYKFIHKYYHVIKGQYKHDTIYKIYDIDEMQFKYTTNSRCNRARDKNLGKIINIVNKYHSDTKNNLSKINNNNQEILTIEPNIESFVSRRTRYKDLKS